MKQSAVEWLQEALSLTFEQEMQFEGLFQQAKEMENQQNLDMLIKFTDERTFLRKEVTKIWFEQFKKK
jgi:hypothetical protein